MSKRSLKTFAAAVAATAGLALVLTGCGSSNDNAGSNSLHLIKAGTLTVCSDVPYPPFEDYSKTSPTGFQGFDVDITSYIAKKLGLKLAWKNASFNGLKSGLTLNAGDCDMAASAMTITAQRAEHLSFSHPYYDSEQSLLVPDGSSIKNIGDLAGKKVGVEDGTTGQAYAQAHSKATVVSFPNDANDFEALKAGQIDAIIDDLPVNVQHAKAGGFQVVQTYDTHEQYGLAMKHGNTALVKAVNKALAEMKSDGTYKTDYDKYFSTGN